MSLKWNSLNSVDQLLEVQKQSHEQLVLIFKHSTSCSISRTALDRLERNWKSEEMSIAPYYLDLLAHRDVSNRVATDFGVEHQSPQVLILRNGKSVYNRSHLDIDFKSIRSFVENPERV